MKIYYVYAHVIPHTTEIVYVGHGRDERAWICRENNRASDHAAWCLNMMECGYTPNEWVRILYKNLDKKTAAKIELSNIDHYRPVFNKTQGAANLKVTPEMLKTAQKMRESGMFYHLIAEELNVSTMAIHRALNGKTKQLV